VLRIEPPLTVTEEQAARFLDALEETCSELAFLNDIADRVLSKSVGTHQDELEKRCQDPLSDSAKGSFHERVGR
jgi:hypothetical protein